MAGIFRRSIPLTTVLREQFLKETEFALAERSLTQPCVHGSKQVMRLGTGWISLNRLLDTTRGLIPFLQLCLCFALPVVVLGRLRFDCDGLLEIFESERSLIHAKVHPHQCPKRPVVSAARRC